MVHSGFIRFGNLSIIYQISKHQNRAELKNLDDSLDLSSDFPGLRTFAVSMTLTASMTSVASMTSTASIHQHIYWSGCGFAQYLHKFLPFENNLTIEDIITASVNILRGQGILKRQKSVQKCKKPQSEVNKGLANCRLPVSSRGGVSEQKSIIWPWVHHAPYLPSLFFFFRMKLSYERSSPFGLDPYYYSKQ